MSFQECVVFCAGDADFVAEFNRLTGHHMGERRSGLTAAIDAACGYDPDREAFPAFLDFVYYCVWSVLYGKEC